MLDASTVAKLTTGSAAGWTLVVIVLGWIVKTWPAWKQRVNEARKIQLDADGKFREDLMERIRDLEHSLELAASRVNQAIEDERRRCEAEMSVMRADFQKQIDGVVRQFLTFQVATGNAIPPMKRSPEIDAALDSL
jgi:hypothetical protein